MPPPSSRAADWLEIAVEVAGIDAEAVAETFREHCPGGVAIEPAFRSLVFLYAEDFPKSG